MRTRIAYLTADEVNHTLAQRMAQECGARVVRMPPGVVPPGGTLIARLHDLDHVPLPQRKTILKDLLSGPPTVPVAVHSYNLKEDQMASLRANGVIVSRSLEPALVRRLCQASEPHQEPLPFEGDQDEGKESAESATLCTLVRSLATQAHRTLTRTPCASSEEFHELHQQLAELQLEIDRLRRSHALRFDELQRWLETLLQRVQDRHFDCHLLGGSKPSPLGDGFSAPRSLSWGP